MSLTHALGIQVREETLQRRVIAAVTAMAHAAGDAKFLQQRLEALACVLASLIRMMQQLTRFASSPNRRD